MPSLLICWLCPLTVTSERFVCHFWVFFTCTVKSSSAARTSSSSDEDERKSLTLYGRLSSSLLFTMFIKYATAASWRVFMRWSRGILLSTVQPSVSSNQARSCYTYSVCDFDVISAVDVRLLLCIASHSDHTFCVALRCT